jgi:hypothetical protein
MKYRTDLFIKNGVEMLWNENIGTSEIVCRPEWTSNERAKILRRYWRIMKKFTKELSIEYYIEEVLKATKCNFTSYFKDE